MVDWPIGLECRSIKVSSNRKTNGYINIFVSLLHTMGALLREWHSAFTWASNSTHTLDQYIHDYISTELCIKNNASRLKGSINVANFTLHHAYIWFIIDSHWVSKAEESEKSFRTTGGVQLQCLSSNDRNVLTGEGYWIRSTCADCCPMTLQSALLFHFDFFLNYYN